MICLNKGVASGLFCALTIYRTRAEDRDGERGGMGNVVEKNDYKLLV